MTASERPGPQGDDGPLIRLRGVGRYFGAPIELDAGDAALAWDLFLRILGFEPKPRHKDNIRRTTLAAGQVLDDINLDIHRGEIVCLEGASGAGKSVLLRVIAGVLQPTDGRVEVSGRVSSLLRPGDNLDDRLTARECVDVQRRLKGLPSTELDKYLAEVMGFAQLEGLEDVVVRTFSTGMRMRLSLAIALLGDPDILLVDDVLAVGDISFQQRCVQRLLELRDEGITMLLSFSDQELVRRLATRVVRLRAGRIVADASPGAGILPHHAGGSRDISWEIDELLPANELAAVTRVDLSERQAHGRRLLTLDFEILAASDGIVLQPSIILQKERANLLRSAFPRPIRVDKPDSYRFTVDLGAELLREGRYGLTVALRVEKGDLLYPLKAHDVVKFSVGQPQPQSKAAVPLSAVQLPWEIERVQTPDQAA